MNKQIKIYERNHIYNEWSHEDHHGYQKEANNIDWTIQERLRENLNSCNIY